MAAPIQSGNGKPNIQIEHLPYAFARHQIIIDSKGKPVDYLFTEVNTTFEEMTGLKRSEVLGKRITAVQPEIEKSNFDWIGTYGQVALSGQAIRFENYSEPLKRWYDVSAYCDEPGYFCVIFRDTTAQKQLEEEITKSRLLFQSVVNTQQEMVSRYLPDTTLTFVNDAYCRIFGKKAQDLLGCKFLEFIPPAQQAYIKELIDGLTPDKPSVTHEHQAVLADGSIQWQEWTEKAFFNESGAFKELQGVGRDTTERKKAADALRESQFMLQMILNTVPQSIFWKDTKSRYLGCNQVFANSLGLSGPEDIIGKTDYDLPWPKDDSEAYRADDLEVLTDSRPKLHIIEQLQITSDTRIWVDTSKLPLMDESGKPFAVLGIYENITERKQAEEALLKSEKEFRATFELASAGIVQVDPQNGQIIRYNKTFRDIVGYPDEELRKTNFPALTHPEDRQNDWEIFSRAARGETPNYQNEKRYIRKDGSIVWVRLNAAFVRDDTGKPIRTIAICEDITDRKKTEKALVLQAKERAAVDAFTYSVSHDLQAPLRRIEGFGEALLEECADLLNLQARDYLNRIIHQISSMKALTDALLRLSKVVSRSMDREKVDLSGLIRSHIEKFRYKEPGREVEMVIAPGLAAEGDTELLSIALENLLENAWKFSAERELARVEFGSRQQEGNTVYYISDNGAGFNMEHADKLFTPFQKLHSEGDYPGIGIGLNIVYRIISRHDGEIWAEGAEGAGATFFFTLP